MRIPLTRYWALLAGYLRPQRGKSVALTALLLTSIVLKLFIPQITRVFIDSAHAGEALAELMLLAGAFIIVAVVQQALAVFAAYFGEVVAWNATNALRVDVTRHCLDLDMSFHKDRTPGEMIQRLDEDVTALARFFSQLVVIVGGNLLLMVGVLVALFAESWVLGATFTAFAFVSVVILNRLREIAIPLEVKRREALADLLGYLEERLSGTEDVRSSGAVEYVINGLYRMQSNLLFHWRNVAFRYWLLGAASRGVTVLGYTLAFVVGYYLFNGGVIGLGTAFLIIHYMNLLARPLRELTYQVEGLQGVGASIERIEELTGQTPTVQDGPGAALPSGALPVSFEHVSFGYDVTEPVLRDVSLHLPAGKILGLLGRTGSGKTTLARLGFRLYDANGGAIRLGEVDIRETRLDELRSRVAMVTQDVQLFQASIRDNLTFFDPDLSDDRIHEVLEQVELRDWLERLPEGLDTALETGGRSMSAGEAQLLAFARVFLRDPGLVILDEASSRLDPATERRIERAMDRLLDGRTAIIIAHRLGTVARADDILILESGGVLEYDRREALIARPDSHFSRLLATGLEKVSA